MDKVSYSLGISVGHNLLSSGVKNINVSDFARAIDTMLQGGKSELPYEEVNDVLNEFFGKLEEEKKEAQESSNKKNQEEGQRFLEENKKRANVVCLASGLQYEILKEGKGKKPSASDNIECHYHGTLIDGTVFDSSVERKKPASFRLNQVIKGWVEALQLMPVGSKWKLYIPSDLAYGPNGAGGLIGPNATLIFEVELLNIL